MRAEIEIFRLIRIGPIPALMTLLARSFIQQHHQIAGKTGGAHLEADEVDKVLSTVCDTKLLDNASSTGSAVSRTGPAGFYRIASSRTSR